MAAPDDKEIRCDHGLPDLLTWRAGVLSDPIRDAALLWGVVVLVVISRWLAFPASIWDMDEANFSLGVLRFDPIHNQPHPPFFPLWIALGKFVLWIFPSAGPAGALQLASAVFSTLILWPLRSLWSMILPKAHALAATTLYLVLPGPWLLSGRAYSDPAATTMLITSLVLWLPRETDRQRLISGGVMLVGTLLIRPQWLLALFPMVLWRLFRCTNVLDRIIVVGVPAALGSAVVMMVSAGSGGLSMLWAAVEQHRNYITGASVGFEWGFADLAVHSATGGIIAGTLWLSLAILGCGSFLNHKGSPRAAGVVVFLVIAPFAVLLLATQNPTLPRYALPLLALTSGFVVSGLSTLLTGTRWTLWAVGVWIVISVGLTAPALERYRKNPSPVVAALQHLESSPHLRLLAVDRRLVAFTTLEHSLGRLRQQVVWDYQVELGMVASPFRADVAALAIEQKAGWIDVPRQITRFSCGQPMLRRVASPRFLDVTVVEGCALVRPGNPSVRPEDLRSGRMLLAPRD